MGMTKTTVSAATTSSRRLLVKLAGLGVLSVALLLVGCSNVTPSAPPPTPTVSSTPNVGTTPAAVPATQVLTYRVATTPAEQKAADPNGLIQVPVTIPAGSKDTAKFALTSMTLGEGSPLPPGTQLLGIKIDPATKIATVDFSKEFKTNFAGGDEREAQTINAVLATMGQFPSVSKVQFLVEGKTISSLGGTEELTSPLPTPQTADKVASNNGGG